MEYFFQTTIVHFYVQWLPNCVAQVSHQEAQTPQSCDLRLPCQRQEKKKQYKVKSFNLQHSYLKKKIE